MPPFIRPLGNPHDGKRTCLSFWGPCTQARAANVRLVHLHTHTLRCCQFLRLWLWV